MEVDSGDVLAPYHVVHHELMDSTQKRTLLSVDVHCSVSYIC